MDDLAVLLESGSIAQALDLSSVAFGAAPAMRHRSRAAAGGVEGLSAGLFWRLVPELRRAASFERQGSATVWRNTNDPEYPGQAALDGVV